VRSTPTFRIPVERRSAAVAPEPRASEPRHELDRVVVEEPLEIRVSGDTLAVTMRTPGHDRELVLGFLWSEGIIRSPRDVSALAHCSRVEDDARGNVVEVTLAPGVVPPCRDDDSPFARRGTITTSACGVCGRRSIDDLVTRFASVPEGGRLEARVLVASASGLRDRQPVFAETGGCHAASLVTFGGDVVATFEDVGRHNAVDKLVGSRVRAGAMPLSDHLLVVSGRASFEIVQKALAAGIPAVASVSAASSLAVELARRGRVTLVGFTRGETFTVYAGGERIA
jgi:FdhD protein